MKLDGLSILLGGMAATCFVVAYLQVAQTESVPEEAHTVPTFTSVVEQWSVEIDMATLPVQATREEAGNCLPVAVELQRRIVATGRMAVIVVVKYPEKAVGHALVMFNDIIGGRFDSLIDNGYDTYNVVLPRSLLTDGAFGEYIGTCKSPDIVTGSCGHLGTSI